MKSFNGLYLMGQYPDEELFKDALKEGLRYFDFIEIGIPFSDPVADGPVISAAADQVLKRGFHFDSLLQAVKEARHSAPADKKFYWMTYANILFYHGWGNFLQSSKNAGIDGIIVPDIPFVESSSLKKACHRKDIKYIHFATPENTEDQIKQIASSAEGFLYFVSIRGVTGSRLEVDEETEHKIQLAREYSSVPVVLGFGIKDTVSAGRALKLADGFIVGTTLVEALKSGSLDTFSRQCRELTAGLNR